MNTEAIIGAAGTGKSFLLRQRIEANPQYALLSASTGIAAVNLGEGVTTVHSALGFFDIRSLREAAQRGQIKRKALELASRGKLNIVIDEVSMFSADHLQLVHEGFQEAAAIREERGLPSCGVIVTGDACQLQPVNDMGSKEPVKLFFEAACWTDYEANLTHLTQVHRQDNPAFLAALQLARAGRGVDAAIALMKCGVEFADTEDENFDGITLFPVNKQVDSYNERRLEALPGSMIKVESARWGKERGEWKNIPQTLRLKDGALVMVLANEPGTFRYVNGDLGAYRVGCVETKRGFKGIVPRATRRNISFAAVDSREDAFNVSTIGRQLNLIEGNEDRSKRWFAIYLDYVGAKTMHGEPYYDPKERGTVVGEVEYMPLRLAYASSYNKVQGLTMDKVQISINHFWAQQPGMMYVALSRARGPEGVRVIGNVTALSKKIKTDARVRRWV